MSDRHIDPALDGELDLITCPECSDVASIEWQAWIGDLLHLKIRCIHRHWFLMPAEHISRYGTGIPYVRGLDLAASRERWS